MITLANDRTSLSVACFPPWMPAELVRAVGGLAWPLRLAVPNALAFDRESSLCTMASCALSPAARLDDADALVFGSTCDTARNLAVIIARRRPGLHVEYVHFPENLSGDIALDWFSRELERVLRGLALLAGERVGDDDLEEAILAYDRVRAAIERLREVRRREPARISRPEMEAALSNALAMPAEHAEAALREARIRALERHVVPRSGVRAVAVGGSCHRPSRALLAELEASGIRIVDDDLDGQLGLLGAAVGCGPERPLRRMARAFIGQRRGSLPRGGPAPIVARARELDVSVVVLLAPRTCAPVLLDLVLLQPELERAGIAVLRVDHDGEAHLDERVRAEALALAERAHVER